MTERPSRRQSIVAIGALASVVVSLFGACRSPAGSHVQPAAATFRIGVSVGQMAASDPQNGLRQVSQNQAVEGLVKIGEDGRPTAWLADSWEFTRDGRKLTVHLRPGLTFHDGSPATAPVVVAALEKLLPSFMGPAFADVQQIRASGDRDFEISFREHSPFVLEALELQFRSPAPGNAGTGPFEPVGPASPTEFRANSKYYLGRPVIDRLAVNTYPTARAAWAEMLRDHLDMLYEVSPDALDSLERSNKIQVFSYVSHYQYSLIFNTHRRALQSPTVRKALSQAIDREAIVSQGLNRHGIPSSGPIWPLHWAFGKELEKISFDPQAAVRGLSGAPLHFTCLVPPDYERLALVVKRQLDAVNVSMDIKEVPPEAIYEAMAKREFDAVLMDVVSGPSLFRLFLWWHSGTANPAGFSSASVDGALDRIRHAGSDNEYRSGVASFQHAMIEDPPAVFLAWRERARAVSKRFDVIDAEPGRDILSKLRLWRPSSDAQNASRN